MKNNYENLLNLTEKELEIISGLSNSVQLKYLNKTIRYLKKNYKITDNEIKELLQSNIIIDDKEISIIHFITSIKDENNRANLYRLNKEIDKKIKDKRTILCYIKKFLAWDLVVLALLEFIMDLIVS